MSDTELEKLIVKYQNRADAAEQLHQETGMRRYYTASWRNRELADTLRMAQSAKEDHDALISLRMTLANFASSAVVALSQFQTETERAKLAVALAKEIAEYGQLCGLI